VSWTFKAPDPVKKLKTEINSTVTNLYAELLTFKEPTEDEETINKQTGDKKEEIEQKKKILSLQKDTLSLVTEQVKLEGMIQRSLEELFPECRAPAAMAALRYNYANFPNDTGASIPLQSPLTGDLHAIKPTDAQD